MYVLSKLHEKWAIKDESFNQSSNKKILKIKRKLLKNKTAATAHKKTHKNKTK